MSEHTDDARLDQIAADLATYSGCSKADALAALRSAIAAYDQPTVQIHIEHRDRFAEGYAAARQRQAR